MWKVILLTGGNMFIFAKHSTTCNFHIELHCIGSLRRAWAYDRGFKSQLHLVWGGEGVVTFAKIVYGYLPVGPQNFTFSKPIIVQLSISLRLIFQDINITTLIRDSHYDYLLLLWVSPQIHLCVDSLWRRLQRKPTRTRTHEYTIFLIEKHLNFLKLGAYAENSSKHTQCMQILKMCFHLQKRPPIVTLKFVKIHPKRQAYIYHVNVRTPPPQPHSYPLVKVLSIWSLTSYLQDDDLIIPQ